VHIPNPNGVLRPNMYAHVKILPKIKDAWTLPADSVLSDILADGDRSYCFIAENGKAHKLFVQVGARCEEGLQVLRKQAAGKSTWEDFTGKEVVITTNNKALQDGQEVQLKSSATP
jgi:hypothetical protein